MEHLRKMFRECLYDGLNVVFSNLNGTNFFSYFELFRKIATKFFEQGN